MVENYGKYMFNKLLNHIGHNVEVVTYGQEEHCGTCPIRGDPCKECDGWIDGFNVWNIAIECHDCNEVLIDFDNPDIHLWKVLEDLKEIDKECGLLEETI